MSGVIGVCSPSFTKNQKLKALLSEELPQWSVRYCNSPIEMPHADLVHFLAEADVAIIGKEQIDFQILAKLPNLKAISKYGVGLDNIDTAACKSHGVKLYHTPGVNRHAVAEMTVGMMISVLRNISLSNHLLKQGVWRKNGGQQLWGKTVGIVGCGSIGSEVAKLLRAFDCKVLICDILDKSEFCAGLGVTQVPLDELLGESQIVSLHIPLTKETRCLIDKENLAKMGSNSVLINTSRGEVVDQEHLKQALKHETILAAAIDVFTSEPCKDQELLDFSNLLATPHIAGNAIESVEAMGLAAISGVRHFVLSQN